MTLLDHLVELVAERSTPVWVVGGCVRDRLLGRPAHDVDLITADAIGLGKRLARRAQAAFVTLDDGRGTARVVARDRPAETLDIAQPQGDLLADLGQRDFTVNAIACSLADWFAADPAWIDPSGGQADLLARRLRVCHQDVLRADPLRVLRGHRLAAQLRLSTEPETRHLMREALPGLAGVASERVRVEWLGLLAAPDPADELRCAQALGTLRQLGLEHAALSIQIERLGAALALLQEHAWWADWLAQGEHLALTRWACLLPSADESPSSAGLSRRFATSRAERSFLAAARSEVGLQHSGLAQALIARGPTVGAALVAQVARGQCEPPAVAEALAVVAQELVPRTALPLLVTGADLCATLGYTPGPELGRALGRLRLAQVLGELSEREAALAAAQQWLEQDG